MTRQGPDSFILNDWVLGVEIVIPCRLLTSFGFDIAFYVREATEIILHKQTADTRSDPEEINLESGPGIDGNINRGVPIDSMDVVLQMVEGLELCSEDPEDERLETNSMPDLISVADEEWPDPSRTLAHVSNVLVPRKYGQWLVGFQIVAEYLDDIEVEFAFEEADYHKPPKVR